MQIDVLSTAADTLWLSLSPVLFDQRFWSYQATTWSDLALTYTIALS